VAGILAWCFLAWKSIKPLDEVKAHSDEGGSLVIWALTGTVLMIVSMIILQSVEYAAKREASQERTPQR